MPNEAPNVDATAEAVAPTPTASPQAGGVVPSASGAAPSVPPNEAPATTPSEVPSLNTERVNNMVIPQAVPDNAVVDPRLQHLIQHYMPEGMDVNRELQFVIESIDADGNRVYEYRPHPVTMEAGNPVPNIPATEVSPGSGAVAETPASAILGLQAGTVVAPAPETSKDIMEMTPEELDAHYEYLQERSQKMNENRRAALALPLI